MSRSQKISNLRIIFCTRDEISLIFPISITLYFYSTEVKQCPAATVICRLGDHSFKTSANFTRFLTPPPFPSAVFYNYLLANLTNARPLPPSPLKNADVWNEWFLMRIITQWLSKICQKACNFLVNHDATWYMINKSRLVLN